MTHIRDDRDEEKPRRCLRCSEMFLSKHAGNRICPECTSKPVPNFPITRTGVEDQSVESDYDDFE